MGKGKGVRSLLLIYSLFGGGKEGRRGEEKGPLLTSMFI